MDNKRYLQQTNEVKKYGEMQVLVGKSFSAFKKITQDLNS